MYSRHVVAERLITNSVLAIKRTSLLWNSPLSCSVDKLDDIDNKYNNGYHSIVKMKPADVKSTHVWNLVKKLITKILYLEMVILLGYQILDTFLQKAMLQISLKSFLCLKKLKKVFYGHKLSVTLRAIKLLGPFT